jgi:putative spermidine/putrescine transport system substrate-binding protein
LRGGIGAAAMGAALACAPLRAEERVLFVNTFGGAMEEAEAFAYYGAFTERTGVRVRSVSPVSFAKLKAVVQSRNYEWDVSSTGVVDVQQAIDERLLEPIDFALVDRARIPPNLLLGEHGIANISLAVCLVYRKDKFPRGGPRSWADFWDVERFPGARALYDRSFTNLAFALLADGVARDALYPLDLDRAFRKLDAIKPHIKVWWTQGSQSQQLIRDGEVDMIAMWNARAQDLIDAGAPLEIVWNGAEHMMGYWFVPRGTPRAKWAWQFVAVATEPERQAAFCNRLPYGPSQPRAFDFIAPERSQKMPTWPEHLQQGFAPEPKWLAPNMPKLRERWTQWMVS